MEKKMAKVKKSDKMVARFGGRESIFLISHTNEFCGKSKVAREPVVACIGLGGGRTTYEECPRSPGGRPRGAPGWAK